MSRWFNPHRSSRPVPTGIKLTTRIWFPSRQLAGWQGGLIPHNLDFSFRRLRARLPGRLEFDSLFFPGDSAVVDIDVPSFLSPEYALPELGEKFYAYQARPPTFLPTSTVIGHGTVLGARDPFRYSPDAKVRIEYRNRLDAEDFAQGRMFDLSFYGDPRTYYRHFGRAQRLPGNYLCALLCIHEQPVLSDSIYGDDVRKAFSNWLAKNRTFVASRLGKTLGRGEIMEVELMRGDSAFLHPPRRNE